MSRLMKRVLLLVAFLALILGALVYLGTREKPQQLQIKFMSASAGSPVKIYEATASDDDINPSNFISDKYLRQTVNQDTTLSLKKGKYIVASNATADYSAQVSVVTLADKPEVVEINPEYTTAKLTSLLQTDAAKIKQVITKALTPSISGFEILPGKLYEKGEWYATTIRPKLSDEERRLSYTDTYRIVLKKTNGTWQLATYPELMLSSQAYPDIPKDVLIDVNKQ